MAYKQPSAGLPFKQLGSSPAKQPYDRSFKEVFKNPDPYSPKGGNWSPPASQYVSEYELSGTEGGDKQLKLDKAKKVAKKSGQKVVVDPKTNKATLKTTRLKKLKRVVGHPTVKKVIGKALKVLNPIAEAKFTYDLFSHGIKNVKEGKHKISKGHYKKGGKGYQKKDYSKSFNYGDKK
jgi:hypothetical protein